MENVNLDALKFPLGKYVRETDPNQEILHDWINDIEQLPNRVEQLTSTISATQLNWIYRPDGWTIRQVVHHLADSHMNSFIRFKLALTEESPVIRPYLEDRWAMLSDVTDVEIDASLDILKGVHRRWTVLIQSLDNDLLSRDFIHPEHNRKMTLRQTIGLYSWHCNHHLAHINQAIKFKGEF